MDQIKKKFKDNRYVNLRNDEKTMIKNAQKQILKGEFKSNILYYTYDER